MTIYLKYPPTDFFRRRKRKDLTPFPAFPEDDVFTVRVTRLDDVWLAEYDRLGLITEADGCAVLKDRARRIAPELAEINGLGVHERSIRLQFRMMAPPSDSDLG